MLTREPELFPLDAAVQGWRSEDVKFSSYPGHSHYLPAGGWTGLSTASQRPS